MKKKIITIAALCSLLAFNKAFAQQWDGSGVNTTTSMGTPRVGIGTPTPTSELQIERTHQPGPGPSITPMQLINENIYTGGLMEPIHSPYNIFEIKSTRNYAPLLWAGPPPPPPPPPVTVTNLFVNTNTPNQTIVGINKSTGAYTLDVGGTINADDKVIAENELIVNNGSIKLNHPSDWDRAITANTTNHALNLFAGTSSDDACIRLFGRNNTAAPGGIQFITRGTSGSETAHAFFTYHGSGWNNLFLIKKDGKINIPGLATGSNKMVIADGAGTLSTANIPVVSNYSLEKSGNDIQLKRDGTVINTVTDGLGNHVASTDLNMTFKNVNDVNELATRKVIFLPGAGTITAGIGSTTIKTNGKLEIAGTDGGSDKLYVNGTSKMNGNVAVLGTVSSNGTVLTSDKRYKENIVSFDNLDILQRLKSINAYQYNFKHDNDRQFDNRKHYGFIAQDIQAVFPELVKEIDDKGYLGINYTEFIPMLLQALKEEDQQVQSLQQKVNTLEEGKTNTAALQNKLVELEKQLATANSLAAKLEAQQIAINQLQNKLAGVSDNTNLVNSQQKTIQSLQEKIAIMEADMNLCCQAKNTHTGDVNTPALRSSLDQNVPNPFNADTKIGFNIVGEYHAAFIGIYDLNGKQIKQIPVEQGMNHVMFNNNNMIPGMYIYSLIVDNQLVDSKKMIVAE